MKEDRTSLLALACLISFFCPTPDTPAQNWTMSSAPTTNWYSVAASADGTKLAAVVNGGGIWISTNSGGNWIQTAAPIYPWRAIASSSNGIKLAAAIGGGRIYTSTDSGTAWRQASASSNYWTSIAASADGNKLVAATSGGRIFTSSNFGTNWTTTSTPITNWTSVVCSSDGTKLVAGCSGMISTPFGSYSTGAIYTSANSGAGWVLTSAPSQIWVSVASSSDGKQLVGVGFQVSFGSSSPSEVYISTNAGTTWNAAGFSSSPSEPMTCIVSSADGTKLVGGEALIPGGIFGSGGSIFSSTNAGVSWNYSGAPNQPWSAVASSADGSKLVAVVGSKLIANAGIGGIYIWRAAPLLSLAASNSSLSLSWPANSAATDFVLQQNSYVASTNWLNVTNTPVVVGNRNQVILSATEERAFFRLKL